MKDKARLKIPEYIRANFDKYKYVLLVCALGLILVLWPALRPAAGQEPAAEGSAADTAAGGAETLARALEEAFQEIDGVGRARVLLTVKSGYESVYVYNQSQSGLTPDAPSGSQVQTQLVTIDGGGEEAPVVRKINYPVFMGAVVVCEGGGSPKVRLELTQAIRSLTGIGADNIVITKMKQ